MIYDEFCNGGRGRLREELGDEKYEELLDRLAKTYIKSIDSAIE